MPSSRTSRTAPARNSSVNDLRGRRDIAFDSWSMWDTVSAFRSVSTSPDQAHQTAEMVERARTQKLHRTSEERFRAFVLASSDAAYRMSADLSEVRQLVGRDFDLETKTPTATLLDKYFHPDDGRA